MFHLTSNSNSDTIFMFPEVDLLKKILFSRPNSDLKKYNLQYCEAKTEYFRAFISSSSEFEPRLEKKLSSYEPQKSSKKWRERAEFEFEPWLVATLVFRREMAVRGKTLRKWTTHVWGDHFLCEVLGPIQIIHTVQNANRMRGKLFKKVKVFSNLLLTWLLPFAL